MLHYVKLFLTLLCAGAIAIAAAHYASTIAVAAGVGVFILGWLNGVGDVLVE